MRSDTKPNTKGIGHSKAVGYRNGTFSVCSDLEAMVDAYGLDAVQGYAMLISRDLAEHGDSIYNGLYNSQLNSMPLPRIRKQNKPENKAKARKKA